MPEVHPLYDVITDALAEDDPEPPDVHPFRWQEEIRLLGSVPELWLVLIWGAGRRYLIPRTLWAWKEAGELKTFNHPGVIQTGYPGSALLSDALPELVGAIRLPVPSDWRSMMTREMSRKLEAEGLA